MAECPACGAEVAVAEVFDAEACPACGASLAALVERAQRGGAD